MKIFIKTLTGMKLEYIFQPETPISVVKQRLQENEGIGLDQIRLIYSGKQLSDVKSLVHYNIAPGDTIHMVLQLRGGVASRFE